MKKKFMIFWEPSKKPGDEYISLIPSEIIAAEKLKKAGSIVCDWISSDRSKGWLLMQAGSEEEVIHDLKTLPLYDFLRIEITELLSQE